MSSPLTTLRECFEQFSFYEREHRAAGKLGKALTNQQFANKCEAAYHDLADKIHSPGPIPMVLHCPRCGTQHIDRPTPAWPDPPHRSHLCMKCGTIWRPADVPTTGVICVQTRSMADNWSPPT